MLAQAIHDIDLAVRTDEAERLRRAQERADLRRAEQYLWSVEDLVEDGQEIPETLTREMSRFVRPHSRRLARQLTAAVMAGDGAEVLNVLFDLQERIQQRMAAARVLEVAPAA